MSQVNLTQKEIDALVNIAGDEEQSAVPEKKISPYDFRRPDRISKEQLRTIRNMHEKASRILATEYSSSMRTLTEVRLKDVSQMIYAEFIMSISSPTNFSIFYPKPLDGSCIFEMSSSISFPMIDKLLGGKATPFEAAREFTDIEQKIYDSSLAKAFLKAIRDVWRPVYEFMPHLEPRETAPNIQQVIGENEIILMVVLEVVLGENTGLIHLCYPVITMESVLPKLSKDVLLTDNSVGKTRRNEIQTLAGGAATDIDVILGETFLSIKEILGLRVSDNIRLNTKKTQDVKLAVNGKYKWLAGLGSKGFNKAAKLNKKYVTEKDSTREVLKQLERTRKKDLAAFKREMIDE